jgi:peptidoglycan hydrolase-like protein with peptidoglycan-binding domain
VNGVFGPLTAKAIRAFQMKYGVIQSETDPGSGVFGSKTRAKFSEIFGPSSMGVQPASSSEKVGPAPAQVATPASASADASALQEQIRALQAKIIQAQIKAIQDKINALKQ